MGSVMGWSEVDPGSSIASLRKTMAIPGSAIIPPESGTLCRMSFSSLRSSGLEKRRSFWHKTTNPHILSYELCFFLPWERRDHGIQILRVKIMVATVPIANATKICRYRNSGRRYAMKNLSRSRELIAFSCWLFGSLIWIKWVATMAACCGVRPRFGICDCGLSKAGS